MNLHEQQRFDYLYQQHLTNLTLQGKRPATIGYQDSQTHTKKIRTLPALEFLWLVLQHVLPKGLRRVRDYGVLRGHCRPLLRRIQLMLAVAGAVFPPLCETKRTLAIRYCPCCQQPMRFMGVSNPHRTTMLQHHRVLKRAGDML
jgi:hypothetical protein